MYTLGENLMKEIHLICNAHIDPIWQWDWQEGVSAVLSTFRSAVNLAREFDYVFCHNEVTVYKYVEDYAPELFPEIKELCVCDAKIKLDFGKYDVKTVLYERGELTESEIMII